MTKAKKAILITFIVLLALAVLILGIIWGILNSGYLTVQRFISLDKLSTVMGDDIVYLSDDFLTVNNLERVGFLGNADYADSVMISYNGFKVNPDLSARVENIDECSYYLSSKADSEGIPVNIDVYFSTKKDKKKYDQEYKGYKYCTGTVLDDDTVYYIKTTPRKRATCIMILRITVKEDVADNYTEEQKKERIEQIFKSAVDNIQTYSEYVDKTN